MGYVFLAIVLLGLILFYKPIISILIPRSPIKTVREFYSEVDAFANTLREQGYASLAEKVEQAQLKGSLGSEIIGDIGFALREVITELPKTLVPKAKELQNFARWHRRLLKLD